MITMLCSFFPFLPFFVLLFVVVDPPIICGFVFQMFLMLNAMK